MTALRSWIFALTQRVGVLRYHTVINLPVRLGRAELKVPVIQGVHPQLGDYEPWLQTVIERVLARRGGAFVDVGANRGQTLLKVAAADPARRYIAFEPNLECAMFVERIIQLNGLSRHTILPVGLADEPGTVDLLLSITGTESSTTVPGLRGTNAYGASKAVVVQRGDTVLESLRVDEVAMIKVDIEGAELEALRGLGATIRKLQPWLVFEVLPPMLVDRVEARLGTPERAAVTARNRERARALQELLEAWGYVFRNVHGQAELRAIASLDMPASADLSMSNFIAVPGNEIAALESLFPSPRGAALSG